MHLTVRTERLRLAETLAAANWAADTEDVAVVGIEHRGVTAHGEGVPADFLCESIDTVVEAISADGNRLLGDDPLALEAIRAVTVARLRIEGNGHERTDRTVSRSALLVMDVQRGIVERFAGDPEYLRRLRGAIEAAHKAGMPVIYVVVRFREGHPEVSTRNKSFAAISGSRGFVDNHTATEIHPEIAPQDGDVVVTKRRVSAFAGSDLGVVLRSAEIDTLVLVGIATSGVVLSTVRQAADLDYRLVVLGDGCLDADPEVHRVLTEKVFPRQADVMTIDAWIGQQGRGPASRGPVEN